MADNEKFNNNDANKPKGERGKDHGRTAAGNESDAEARRIAGMKEQRAKDGNEASVGDEGVHDRARSEA